LRHQQERNVVHGQTSAPHFQERTQSGASVAHIQENLSMNPTVPDPVEEALINEQQNLYNIMDEVCSNARGGENDKLGDPELFEGCKIGRLAFISLLQNIKTICQWSDASVNMLLRYPSFSPTLFM